MQRSSRDCIVTGMGFCLPSTESRPVITADDVWNICSVGISLVKNGDFYHGLVEGVDKELETRWPTIPARYRNTYQEVQKYGLISLHAACVDSGLEVGGEPIRQAAVLTARAGVDSTYDCYHAWYKAVPGALSSTDVRSLFVSLLLGGTWSDVANVQTAAIRSKGTSFVISSGCASSAEATGIGADLIRTGREDLVIVTGADCFQVDRVKHGIALVDSMSDDIELKPKHHSEPAMSPRSDRQMRPYDSRSDCVNYGSGAATLILESREHAERRGVEIKGRIIAQSTVRGGLDSAVALSSDGEALAAAARNTLNRSQLTIEDVDYINGGAEGDPIFARLESNAVQRLFRECAIPPISSQEACFGHSGAPLGVLETAMTFLMMKNGMVCPTAACEQPDESLAFTPVFGQAVPHCIDIALSFNYQVGGVYSSLLLGSANE